MVNGRRISPFSQEYDTIIQKCIDITLKLFDECGMTHAFIQNHQPGIEDASAVSRNSVAV